jgi:hypothetical protein
MYATSGCVVALAIALVVVSVTPTAALEGTFTPASEWHDGACHALTMSGDLLFAQRGGFIDVWEILDPSSPDPVLVSSIPVSPSVADLFVDGDVLYIAEESGKVLIVDVSDPYSPQEIASIQLDKTFLPPNTTSTHGSHVVVDGTTLFLLSNWGLHTYDVTDPANPSWVGEIVVWGTDFVVHGDAVYVAPGESCSGCVWMVDVSNPAAMIDMGYIENRTDITVFEVEMTGDFLVTAGGLFPVSGGLVVYDVDPGSLFSPSPIDTVYFGGTVVSSITTEGDYVYFSPYYEDPNFYYLASLQLSSGSIQNLSWVDYDAYRPRRLASTNELLLVGMVRAGFHTFNRTANPASPMLNYNSDLGGYTNDVEVQGDFAYLAQSARFRILDVSSPTSPPALRGSIGAVSDYLDVSVDGDRAYLLKASGSSIALDVSDPDNPSALAGTLPGGDLIEVVNDVMYAVFGAMIGIYDVSVPDQTTLMTFVITQSFAGAKVDLALGGDYLYIADTDNGVIVCDASNLATQPLPIIAEFAVAGGAQALSLSGDQLLVGSSNSKVSVVSVATPASPEVIGRVFVPGPPKAITRQGTMAYVTDTLDRLHAIDLTVSERPILLGSVTSLRYKPTGLASDGDFVFVSGEQVGVEIWEGNGPEGIVWDNPGPGGGGVWHALRAHPEDPKIVFAGSDVGGIFRSFDGGNSWQTLNDALTEPNIQTRSLNVNEFTFHPTEFSTVYAMTSAGLYRSLDLGESFERLYPPDEEEGPHYWEWSMGAMLIDPADPDRQWVGPGIPLSFTVPCLGCNGMRFGVAGRPHIYATEDNWQTVVQEPLWDGAIPDTVGVHSIVMIDESTILASTSEGLFKRDPATGEWHVQSPLNLPTPTPPAEELGLREMVYEPSTGTLYIVVESCANCGDEDATWHGGIYKSVDNGISWVEANGLGSEQGSPLVNPDFESSGGELPALGWRFNGTHSETTVSVTNEGRNSSQGMTVEVPDGPPLPPGQFHGFLSDYYTIDPQDDIFVFRFYLKVDDAEPTGGFETLDIRAWTKWERPGGTTHVTGRNFNPNSLPPLEWTQYEIYVRKAKGATSVAVGFSTPVPGVKFIVDDVEVASTQALPRVTGYAPGGVKTEYVRLALDEQAGAVYTGLYRGTSSLGGVWRTNDGGDTWSNVARGDNTTGIPQGWWTIHETFCLDVDRWYELWESPTLYYGHDYLYRSLDDGVSWQNMIMDSLNVSHFESRGDVQPVFAVDVAENPGNPSQLFYGDADNRLLISEDDGKTWHRVGRDYYKSGAVDWTKDPGIEVSGDAVTSIVTDPVLPNVIYNGVWVHNNITGANQLDGGVVRGDYDDVTETWSWSRFGDASSTSLLKGGPIDLAVHYDTGDSLRTFYAAVNGKGVYRLQEPDTAWTVLFDIETTANISPVPPRMLASRVVVDEFGTVYVGFGDRISLTIHEDPGEDEIDQGVWYMDAGANEFTRIPVHDDQVFIAMAPNPTGGLLVSLSPHQNHSTGVGDVELVDGCVVQTNYLDKPGGLYRYNHDGNDWVTEKLLAQPRLTSILVGDGGSDDRIYTVSSAFLRHVPAQLSGIYVSEDAGATWCKLPNEGLDCVREVELIHSIHTPAVIYAATSGTGMFRGRLIAPKAPTALAAVDVTGSHVELSWVPPEIAGFGHRVKRRATGEGNWTVIATLGHAYGHTDYAVQEACGYEYAVEAFNEAGSSPLSNVEAAVIPGDPAPGYINPVRGRTLGGTLVTITGSGFQPGATVKFDGVLATNVTVLSCTSIQCRTPQHAAGTVDVRVTNPGGGYGILPAAFEYYKPGKPPPNYED